ncbi:hypothetical protein BDW02DRAFT_409177 [Decorospora gaudefroyi]|uniref:Uncharacterized protein n=1 Tax=Decorospora gaudefroyi TaxID=184978 RepID=A0A6A5K996_9PLEO|nr:hypothetical protein BDW02DRAFT_409177 [Decorospora gaudefroyi]
MTSEAASCILSFSCLYPGPKQSFMIRGSRAGMERWAVARTALLPSLTMHLHPFSLQIPSQFRPVCLPMVAIAYPARLILCMNASTSGSYHDLSLFFECDRECKSHDHAKISIYSLGRLHTLGVDSSILVYPFANSIHQQSANVDDLTLLLHRRNVLKLGVRLHLETTT